jgi:hypothetical protein
MSGSLSVVAYINDKKKLLKYSSASFLFLLVFIMAYFLLPQINHSLSLNNNLMPGIEMGKSSEERISTFSKIINFIAGILKDRLGD